MEVEKCYAPLPDGSVLYYEKTGSGRPLFLLHGNGGSSAYFSKQVDALRQKHQLYLIDSRGHGKSTNTQKKIDFFKMAIIAKRSVAILKSIFLKWQQIS